jgi:hypothetical protein
MMQNALEILLAAHPGQLRIAAVKAGEWIGYAPKTSRNKILQRTFPLQTIKQCGKVLVDLRELAKFLDDGLPAPVSQDSQPAGEKQKPRRPRGRPRTKPQAGGAI